MVQPVQHSSYYRAAVNLGARCSAGDRSFGVSTGGVWYAGRLNPEPAGSGQHIRYTTCRARLRPGGQWCPVVCQTGATFGAPL